ncbi:EKC/KEOPS complex subunit Tprkb-like isoform X2 [Microplitis demolitor]|nr:EKC/KEOPS complex subunit Tprkb-like isoform X2 [Microplitis demolitor]
METYTLELDPSTQKYLTLYLYKDVKNMPDIRKKILSGELECCVLKAALVADSFQVAVAANKAVLREKAGTLVTKSLFTEIIFAMSSSSNISLSLTKFGVNDNDRDILVALIHHENDRESVAEKILRFVDGQKTPISQLDKVTDVKLVRKIYKIEDEELKVSSLVDSIVSRIGGDYPVSLK